MGFFCRPIFAQEPKGLLCQRENGTNEDLPVHLIRHDYELIRLRFTGPVPDRYFSHTGKRVFTQFATKKNTVSPMVNLVVPSSTLLLHDVFGGVRFTWKEGKRETVYRCSRD